MNKIGSFLDLPYYQAADKAHSSHRSKKSSKVVNDGSDDNEVIVLTVPSKDTEIANALKPTTTEVVKSLCFSKEKKTLKEKKSSSINAELGKGSKHPHLECPIANLHKESSEASHIWLSKLKLADKLMADVEVVSSPQETVAGPSHTASQVAK
uniref:Uncharacterized protein n=1 Tax=Moniliophthora roreri TaxID=221103 RepID=A0A0W0FYA1_MONRR